jgi:hypothetical protein
MIKRAQSEIGLIVGAVHAYESDHSRFPASKEAMAVASLSPSDDFTYGTTNLACVGPAGPNPINVGFSIPAGVTSVQTIVGGYGTNNAEVMAILLDLETFGDGRRTLNYGHVKNPERKKYLNATMVGDAKLAGVGPDGVYRDPWGNPYIISLDLNSDGKTRDFFYRSSAVSQDPSDTSRGLNGLIKTTLSNGAVVYEANLEVMVWSAGPDKLIDPAAAANTGNNKDNVLSWK